MCEVHFNKFYSVLAVILGKTTLSHYYNAKNLNVNTVLKHVVIIFANFCYDILVGKCGIIYSWNIKNVMLINYLTQKRYHFIL